MVKLGSNLCDKLEKQPSADDGFDNIPLITPLEVNQLQQSFADKVSMLCQITTAFGQTQLEPTWAYVSVSETAAAHTFPHQPSGAG